MQHLIAEGNDMIAEAEDDATRDALMIAAAQEVEHYEIATHGTIRTWATLLGESDVAAILEGTPEEEKAADRKLTASRKASSTTRPSRGTRRAGRDAPARHEPIGAERRVALGPVGGCGSRAVELAPAIALTWLTAKDG